MKQIAITKYPQMVYSPAYRYMPEAYAELFSNMEHSPGGMYLPTGSEDYVFVAHSVGQPESVYGFLACYDWRLSVITAMAYTRPDFRRRGIHSALFKTLKADAEERGMREISSSAFHSNTASLESQRKQGRTPSSSAFLTRLPSKAGTTVYAEVKDHVPWI
ncbi:GNAT family N-acetyltransferase protein [Rhizobium phage RHph_I42]|nr:GNAT family N-acetyltransferase protein [Rhizobium phage RHph_I42]